MDPGQIRIEGGVVLRLRRASKPRRTRFVHKGGRDDFMEVFSPPRVGIEFTKCGYKGGISVGLRVALRVGVEIVQTRFGKY